MKQDKSLTFSLGLIFLEILSQRPISIVPEHMTAPQYSRYIYRKNRLESLTKLICKCSFNHDDQAKAKPSIQRSTSAFVGNVLLRMVDRNPMTRLSLF